MDLKELRERIDTLDEEILRLLNQRAKIALEIGELKAKTKDSYHDPRREREVIDRLMSMNQGRLFPNAGLRAVYREIISACLSLEKPG